jgi:hypothetical protein
MAVFLSFLVVCFAGSFWLQRLSLVWRGALVVGAAILVCFAYYVLHTL